eukprot:6966-Heterococcus_DN1.PRE.3
MRHVEAFCLGKDTIVDRGYLTFGLASDECAAVVGSTKLLSLAKRMRPALAGHSRLLIFDMGASYYSSGDGGASQNISALKSTSVPQLQSEASSTAHVVNISSCYCCRVQLAAHIWLERTRR